MYRKRSRAHVIAAILPPVLLAGCTALTAAPPTEPAVAVANPTVRPSAPTPIPAATPTKVYVVATSEEQVIGVWHKGSNHIRFDADGTSRQAYALDKLENDPIALSSYTFDGNKMVTVEVSVFGVPGCQGRAGTYELRLLEGGTLYIVTIKDGCEPRAKETEGQYEPVK